MRPLTITARGAALSILANKLSDSGANLVVIFLKMSPQLPERTSPSAQSAIIQRVALPPHAPSANFFSVVGLPPALGRAFTAEEDVEGGPHVVIISDDFWRQQLGGRADFLGTTISIDGNVHTIIGVMPKMFRHPYRANLWLPLALPANSPTQGSNHYLYGVGRLRKGLTSAQAGEAVRRMCAAINQARPDPNNARAAYMPPLRESFVMDLRPKILVIVVAALCVLLVAAANFAGLLLTRVVERESEFSLRRALGAELLATTGASTTDARSGPGDAGNAVWPFSGTHGSRHALVAMSPEGADATGSAMREFDYAVRLDWPVFGFATVVMFLVGLGFGFLPAIHASRIDLRGAMNLGSRSAGRLIEALVDCSALS